MGAKNDSGLRVEMRDGRKIFVVDFRYRDSEGREQRYRRDAPVQIKAAARAEAERLKRLAAERGTLEPAPQASTFEAFVRGDFSKLVVVRLKPSTREGYKRLLFAPTNGLVALLRAQAPRFHRGT